MKFDVIIVGAGCSGSFAAYELNKLYPEKKILLIEAGNRIEKKHCPKEKTGICIKCNPCNITTSFGGSGSSSDCKLCLSKDVGGEIIDLISEQTFYDTLHYIKNIYVKFGALWNPTNPSKEFLEEMRNKTTQNNLKFIEYPVVHLGTDNGREFNKKLQSYLLSKKNITIKFNTKVDSIVVDNLKLIGVLIGKEIFNSDKVILAVGRYGTEWLSKIKEIENKPSYVDIGIRVETRYEIMKEITDNIYELKVINRSNTFDDSIRTFCMNPRGYVVQEFYGDVLCVNGCSYANNKSENTNFALLSKIKFTEPCNEVTEYGKSVAKIANLIAGNKILLQRYGDLKRHRRTSDERMGRGNIKPTLTDYVCGDLALCLPARFLINIVETIENLNNICNGINSDETLLYAPEIKFYSNKIKLDNNFETNIKGLYCLGDSSGWTRGILQSNMMGILCANNIKKEE